MHKKEDLGGKNGTTSVTQPSVEQPIAAKSSDKPISSRTDPKPSRQSRALNPFSCWAGSSAIIKEEKPVSQAEKIAAAVDRGILAEPDQKWDRSKPHSEPNTGAPQGNLNVIPIQKTSSLKEGKDLALNKAKTNPPKKLSLRRTSSDSSHRRHQRTSGESNQNTQIETFTSLRSEDVHPAKESLEGDKSKPTLSSQAYWFGRSSLNQSLEPPAASSSSDKKSESSGQSTPAPQGALSSSFLEQLAIPCSCKKVMGTGRGRTHLQKLKIQTRMAMLPGGVDHVPVNLINPLQALSFYKSLPYGNVGEHCDFVGNFTLGLSQVNVVQTEYSQQQNVWRNTRTGTSSSSHFRDLDSRSLKHFKEYRRDRHERNDPAKNGYVREFLLIRKNKEDGQAMVKFVSPNEGVVLRKEDLLLMHEVCSNRIANQVGCRARLSQVVQGGIVPEMQELQRANVTFADLTQNSASKLFGRQFHLR